MLWHVLIYIRNHLSSFDDIYKRKKGAIINSNFTLWSTVRSIT